jgi:L-alanine-DL-glutamate epimerase-like enolase superfamily enzyme
MKITTVENLAVDAGWSVWRFLKISTDDGVIGWSEYTEDRGRFATSAVIQQLADRLVGRDPVQASRLVAELSRDTRAVGPSGVTSLAIGAIENALLDLAGKVRGLPARELLGGTLRDRLCAYWSHCGMYRSNYPQFFDRPVRTLDDIRELGAEVAAAGFRGLTTNICTLGKPRVPGAGLSTRGTDPFAMTTSSSLVSLAVDMLSAFRDGVAGQVQIALDINFNYSMEGVRRIAHALERINGLVMQWLETDTNSASGLAATRSAISLPIASLETILGRRALRPFLEADAVDVVLIDAVYNGALESARMALMCDAFEVNVAAHNSWSPLGTLINAGFCAAIPNFHILEYDVDHVPWRDELFDEPLEWEGGTLVLNSRPGWGIEPNEEALRAHAVQA